MTKSIFLSLLIAAAGAGVFTAGCSKGRDGGGAPAAQETKTLYTCGMHPEVIQDHPGNCPICGMKLTPVRKQADVPSAGSGTNAPSSERKIKYYKSTMMPDEIRQTPGLDSMGMDMVPVYEEPASAGPQAIAIDPVTIQNMGIRTAAVTRGPLRRTIRGMGVVEYNEAAMTDVATKFKGWIEKLYVNTTGQLVMRGDPLFEIYSPELYSAQAEYLLAAGSATNAAPGAEALRAGALTKLKFLDISDDQIAALERAGQPLKTLRILAPRDGFVTEKMSWKGRWWRRE